ncbi:MAG: FAD-binding oxidoreductase [Alphaproteobacteria bacterium]|nr:MAG: FAD-binding oxidoreductase [Alphaproteobacteria bacterium]
MTEPPQTWYATTSAAAPARPALTHNLDVDVCVVGAGLAGLTVAREVARRGWSVAVLEAGKVAGGASGRNAGFVSPGFAERIDAIVERVGLPRARELWTLSEAGVEYVRRAIAETAMPGVEPRDGRLAVRRTDDEAGLIEHVAMLRVEFGADVEAWPTDQVREVLRSGHYFQAAHYAKAFHIHPLNYALGLAADAERHGARIFQDTQAIGIDPAGVRKRVETPHGLVRAHHVVLAGSTGIGSLDEQIATTVLPVSTYVAVTAPLGEKLFDAVRYTGAVADTRRAGDYYRIVADDRLLWGGRITTRAAPSRRLKAQMRRDILKVYPQLGVVEIEYAWAGTMAYAVHKMPQIGELAPGYWLASAFGGHGLNTTAMAGEMIARAILDGDDRWRLFSSYELVWAGGRAGRVAAQAAYWSMQARDALQGWISRYRDSARRESDERQARWAAEKAARKAEAEARRAEEETRRIAEAEARRLAAEEARKVAAEKALRARQEVERIRQERARAAEEAKHAAEEAARAAAENAMHDAAEAATALPRQIGEHKALTADAVVAEMPAAGEGAPTIAETRKVRRPRKPRASKKKKEVAEPLPPAT